MTPSGLVSVWVDPNTGNEGLANAQDLLADAPRIWALNEAIFGTQPQSVHVDALVFALGGATDGTGGADHMGCDYQSGGAIEVCASFGASERVSSLFEAELSECAMGGNLCGVATGEALSRWCAGVTYQNALSDFATAPVWYADGAANFVDQVDATDQNADSTGCGMAFLSWLRSLGFDLPAIAQAIVSLGEQQPLAALYSHLTDHDAGTAWPTFQAAIGNLGAILSDDPFATGWNLGPSGSPPAPPPPPPPGPGPSPVMLRLDQVISLLQADWPKALGGVARRVR